MQTPYGSVLPSSLFTEDEMKGISSFNKRYRNFGLKMGSVINIIETDDPRNTTGMFPEYDVAVVEKELDVSYSLVVYRNCIRTDGLGGKAEYIDFKLRAPTESGEEGNQDMNKHNGSIVLLNCLDGTSTQAVITGSVQHPERQNILDKEKGHAFIAEFNGLQIQIDQEGAFSVVFQGATDNDGKPLKQDVGGSFFKITENGSLEIGDDNGEIIVLDKENQELIVTAKKNAKIEIGEELEFKVGKGVNLDVGEDLISKIEGSVEIEASSLSQQMSGKVSIESNSMEITAGPQLKAQATQIILDGMVMVGGMGGTPAVLMTTMFLGVGNKGAPVISNAVGPFSAKVLVSQ